MLYYQEFKKKADHFANQALNNYSDDELGLAKVYAQLAAAEAQNKLAKVEALKTLANQSDSEQTKREAMRLLRQIAFTE